MVIVPEEGDAPIARNKNCLRLEVLLLSLETLVTRTQVRPLPVTVGSPGSILEPFFTSTERRRSLLEVGVIEAVVNDVPDTLLPPVVRFVTDITPGAAEGLTDALGLTLALGESELDADAEGDNELLADADGDKLADGLKDGDTDEDGVKSVKINQDIAPSSPFVTPVQVTAVAVKAVVLVAVVNPNAPASTSMSSVAFAQVTLDVSVAFPATAIKPPPVAIVIAPVVSGVVTSMSVDPLPPVELKTPSTTE